MSHRTLEKDFDRLGIIAFESSGLTTKHDVFKAIDAIDANMKVFSDEDTLLQLKERKEAKQSKRFKGFVAE